MQRRHAHRAFEAEGIQHPLRVQARRHPLIDDHAALLVLAHRLGVLEVLDADREDQVALRQVFVVEEDLHVVHARRPGVCAVPSSRRASNARSCSSMLSMPVGEQCAPVVAVAELAAEPAHVVDDLGDDRELPRRRAAQVPEVLLLARQLVVRQHGRALRHPRHAGAPAAEELVGRDVDAVHRRLLQVDQTMRRVLHGVHDDVEVGLDGARALRTISLDVQLGARDVGRVDHAQQRTCPGRPGRRCRRRRCRPSPGWTARPAAPCRAARHRATWRRRRRDARARSSPCSCPGRSRRSRGPCRTCRPTPSATRRRCRPSR